MNALFRGYGWDPHFVEGDDPHTMHQLMAATLEHCIDHIRSIQNEARDQGKQTGAGAGWPRWPMIVLRSPKGWTGPKEVDGHKVEGFWRAHQVPILEVAENPEHLASSKNGSGATSLKNSSTKTVRPFLSFARWHPQAPAA